MFDIEMMAAFEERYGDGALVRLFGGSASLGVAIAVLFILFG